MKTILTVLFSLYASVAVAQQTILTPDGGALCGNVGTMTFCNGPGTGNQPVTIMPLGKDMKIVTPWPTLPQQNLEPLQPLAPLPSLGDDEDDELNRKSSRARRARPFPPLPRDATCPRSWQMMGRC